MMKKSKNQKGFSLVELIIVIAIMVILSAVIAPQFFRYIERSKIAVDQYNVGILNNVTPIYYIGNTSPNPFEDSTKSSTELLNTLVSSGNLTSAPEPKSKGASFIWIFDQEKWYLKFPDSFYVIASSDGLNMANGYLLGAFNGSETYKGSSKDIVIPTLLGGNLITEIGQNTFKNVGLVAISFQQGSQIKQIHARAFSNNNLSTIEFPDSLERIDTSSFANNNLTEIIIPPNVNKIETKAFDGNKDLNKVTIGSDVKTIGTEIFGKNRGDFAAVYTAGGAGTYIWNGVAWVKQ